MDILFQGGSVLRLFHKELEAYLVAEGLFDDEITEDGITVKSLISYRPIQFIRSSALVINISPHKTANEN